MRDNLIQPSGACIPCAKELLCSQLVTATVAAGHQLVAMGSWREAELRAWNAALDETAARLKGMLEAGPLAVSGRSSDRAAAEDWPGWWRGSVEGFAAFVERLPAGERDAAWKAGRDALDRTAAALAPKRQQSAGSPGAGTIGGAPDGA